MKRPKKKDRKKSKKKQEEKMEITDVLLRTSISVLFTSIFIILFVVKIEFWIVTIELSAVFIFVHLNDISITSQDTNNLRIVTLITCNNVNGKRLVVQAKETPWILENSRCFNLFYDL